MKLNDPLPISQIDFRVQSINKGGYATILAYKDARVDMDRLDAVYGAGQWQRKHDLIGNELFCSVGVRDANGDWIWVQDVGTESRTEATKGRASDSFKRACFNLGIGRELYDFPEISVKLADDEWEMGADNKPRATWKLKLKEWMWYMERNEDGVTYLAAAHGVKSNDKPNVRFTWGKRGDGEQVK